MPAPDLISRTEQLVNALADTVDKLGWLVDTLHAEARGVSIAHHKPLQALQAAGQLETVLVLLENLARRPELVDAAFELAHGSSITVVAKCLPESAEQ